MPRSHFTLLGHLTPLYVPPSNMLITPYVAWAAPLPEPSPNPDEVARVIYVPLAAFWAPETLESVTFEGEGWRITAPAYRYDGALIWGATAMILSEFLTLLETFPEDEA